MSRGARRLDEITRADVLDLVAELAKSLSPATVQVVYSHLTSIMSAAVADVLKFSRCRGCATANSSVMFLVEGQRNSLTRTERNPK